MKGLTTMETIKTYIDNAFADYPQTSELQSLKQEILADMQKEYNTLRQNGKSEQDATYSVIASFGNIKERVAELNLHAKDIGQYGKSSVTLDKTALGKPDKGKSIFINQSEAQQYLSQMRQSARMIGLGVWIIIAGVSLVVAFGHAFVLFVAIAIAVGMFILAGSRMGEYEAYDEGTIHLDASAREWVEDEYATFKPRSIFMLIFGIAAIIVASGAFTLNIDIPVPLFLNVVGFSTLLFIIMGITSSTFDTLLDKSDE